MNRFYESAKIAEQYFKYRPRYTPEVAQRVMRFYNNQQQSKTHIPSKLDLMVDVGCGSGQSTNIFQPYFQKISGFDVSAEQIKQAKLQNKFDNIDYMEGSAENIPVEDKSVDLVVAGTAAHWFDLEKFFDEVKRVLKPTGCLVLLSYPYPKISFISDKNEELAEKATKVIEKAITGHIEDPTQKYVHQSLIKNSFQDLYNCIPFIKKQKDDSFHDLLQWSINDTCGFIRSEDSYQSFMKKKIKELEIDNEEITEEILSDVDPITTVIKQLQELGNISDKEINEKTILVDFIYSIFLIKPV